MEKEKILIADDNETIRNLLFDILHEKGYDCKTAGNGWEVINEIKNDSFTLVLLDLRMPLKNGIEVLPEILEHDKDIAVIIVTGVTDIKISLKA